MRPHTHHDPETDPAERPAVSVVLTTRLGEGFAPALRSVYTQDLGLPIQILLGVDAPASADRSALAWALEHRPAGTRLNVVDPGYALDAERGGPSPASDGGALRTALSYLANGHAVAYLHDEAWWAPNHLSTLHGALQGKAWAYALRQWVDPETHRPLGPDQWEAVGPEAGLDAKPYGGYVDPVAYLLDRALCEPIFRLWGLPVPSDGSGRSADRTVFAGMKALTPRGATGLATAYVRMDQRHPNHVPRLTRYVEDAKARLDAGGEPRGIKQELDFLILMLQRITSGAIA